MNDFKKALVYVCIASNYEHQMIECKRTRYSIAKIGHAWKETTRMDEDHVLVGKYCGEETCGNSKLDKGHNICT